MPLRWGKKGKKIINQWLTGSRRSRQNESPKPGTKEETSKAKTGIRHRSDKEGGKAMGVRMVKTRLANAGFQ